MRIAIIDPFAGISGDMTLGALVDAGLEQSWLESLPARVGLAHVGVRIKKVTRCSVCATKIDFLFPPQDGDHDHRHGHTINGLLERVAHADVSDTTKRKATQAFELLGQAEGSVHGVAPQEVHLHEVGAADALLDIVGAIEGFERLGIDAVYNLPVTLGNGWVSVAHGALPVPAPASLILLAGVPIRSAGPVTGEAVTPTGAVLLKVLSDGPPSDGWRVSSIGWGAGSRDPSEYPNALRLILGEQSPEAGVVEIMATNIDDLSPEYVESLRQAVLDAGALDCQVWPTHGKKGRMSMHFEALVRSGETDIVSNALFAHSTSAGVRIWPAVRRTLVREAVEVEPRPGFRVLVKVRYGPRGSRIKAEFDDVQRAAEQLGEPAIDIARDAETLAQSVLVRRQDALDLSD
jgi:uncharacterized protein (TIGR00299 family) protein